MARKPKPAAPHTIPADVATMQTLAEVPALPVPPPVEAASATEGVAAPDVALVQPSIDGVDVVQAPDGGPVVTEGSGPASTRSVVIVTGPAKGRWRAGRQFGPTPVEIDCAELTAEQMLQLEADPELVCVWPDGEGLF
jgi:hypothetical protein